MNKMNTTNKTINDYDDDFNHYECDKATRKKLAQVWTPYSLICTLMDKAGTVDDPKSIWHDETKTNLDPTMGAGNIVIAMLYRRIVECGQDPVTALSNVYGIELDKATLDYAKERIKKFIAHFTKEDVSEIVERNFVCSDIFEWDFENWCKLTFERAIELNTSEKILDKYFHEQYKEYIATKKANQKSSKKKTKE